MRSPGESFFRHRSLSTPQFDPFFDDDDDFDRMFMRQVRRMRRRHRRMMEAMEDFMMREEEQFFRGRSRHRDFFRNPFEMLRGNDMFHRREFPMLQPRSYYDDEPLMLGPGPETLTGPDRNWGERGQMGPDEVKVQLLPNNRMRVSGNKSQDYHDNGYHVKSRRWFQQSMDVPDNVDVERLRGHMDENNELRIKRAQEGNNLNREAIGDGERVVEVKVEHK